MASKNKKKAVTETMDNQLLADKEKLPKGANDNLVDEISENFDRFETFVIGNVKYILAGCIVLLIAVAVVFTVIHFRNQSRAADTLRLANAEKTEQLEKVLKEVSSSVPGYDAAQIRLARQYAAAKKYDLAFNACKAVADRGKDLYLSGRARLDSAYILEQSGKNNEAAVIFAMVADNADSLPDFRAEGAYAAGRLFLGLKNEASAKKYLSMNDPAKAVTPISAQWAELSRAILNRIPAAEIPTAGKNAAANTKAAPAAKK